MAGTELNHMQSVVQTQHQQLSAAQHHALEILSLPLTSLESRLTVELANNPLLEELAPAELPERENPPETSDNDENDYEANAGCAEEWSDELPLPENSSHEPDLLDYLGNSPAPPPSLKTRLLTELEFANCPEELYAPAVEIISALDDDGFITTPLADIAMAADAEMSDTAAALELVQSIAPPGVAARDIAESLKLQLIRAGKMTAELDKLLACGLDDLEKNRIPALCAKLNISPETLEQMLKTLRTLNPAPGREKSSAAAGIAPDIEIIRQENGSYNAIVRQEKQMRIAVSATYAKMLDNPDLAPEVRSYIIEKIQHANELIQALILRGSTLKRLGDVIISEQKNFLDHGVKELKSMTMKQVAAQLELSESTISRAVAEKYADTPQGIFPLRFFFSGGYDSGDGKDLSAQAVKELIRSAVNAEDPRAPLSDEALSALLKEQGLNVARRTVAKYRESMKIPSSSLRKKHF